MQAPDRQHLQHRRPLHHPHPCPPPRLHGRLPPGQVQEGQHIGHQALQRAKQALAGGLAEQGHEKGGLPRHLREGGQGRVEVGGDELRRVGSREQLWQVERSCRPGRLLLACQLTRSMRRRKSSHRSPASPEPSAPTLMPPLPSSVAPKNCQKGIKKWPQQMPHRSKAALG